MKRQIKYWRDMRDGEDYVFTDAQSKDAIVDVKMLTYNHAPYIRHAIESVLMQETKYPYRLLIGDDGSTDGTADIVREYQAKYPDRIATVLWKYNTGLTGKGCNGIVASRYCKAKYIATLEGDDYWTSPRKLEKAVSFLEAHPEYIGYAHNIRAVDENERPMHTLYAHYVVHPLQEEHVYCAKSVLNRHKLADGVLAQTGAIVNRNYTAAWDEAAWDEYSRCRGPKDQIRTDCLGLLGEVFYDREIMSDYRLIFHGTSWVARTVGKNNALVDYRTISDQARFIKKLFGAEVPAFEHILDGIREGSREQLLRRFDFNNLYIYAKVSFLHHGRNLQKRKAGEGSK